MDVRKIAKELGEAIVNTDEYKNLIIAENKQSGDAKAQEQIKEYNDKRKDIIENMQKDSTPEAINNAKIKLEEHFGELMKNSVVKEYVEAKQRFESMQGDVNSIIFYYVNGQQEGGCPSSGCSGCSGCN